jgi:hypothetical protein
VRIVGELVGGDVDRPPRAPLELDLERRDEGDAIAEAIVSRL